MGKTLHEMKGHISSRWLPAGVIILVGCGLILPTLLGLWQTALPAFGLLVSVGQTTLGLDAWRRLAELPGLGTSLQLTITTGFAATALSLLLSVSFYAAFGGGRVQGVMRRLMSPLLASPHAAIAIALAFLIAPSGWVFRLLSPWATGQDFPPNIIIVHDPRGLALILVLAAKEMPFLLFMIAAALRQLPVVQSLAAGRVLGYSRAAVWLRIIFPQVYPQIRLAIYAVLAFSLSVIDAAIIVGPNNPPTLAVQTLRWFSDPNVEMILPASASAILQAIIVAVGIALWWLGERLVMWLGGVWIERGQREKWSGTVARLFASLSVALVIFSIIALVGLAIWSLAWRWSFPDPLPESWSLKIWFKAASQWLPALGSTFSIAAASTLIALVLAIAWLEAEDRGGRRRAGLASFVIYWPLILPQTAFIFGLHIVFLKVGFGRSYAAVIWVHTFFVFPYVMLALADPWRALDRRYLRAAASLGRKPLDILLRIKLPILLGPLLAATAVGFAVSVAQYLPTLTIGEGRIVTLTTEAVARSSGGDRRLIAVFASLQAFLPLIIYVLAFLLPAMIYARRRGLSGERA